MEEHLFTIDAIFQLDHRGVILAPGVPYHCSVRVGEHIELRQQDGTRTPTSILALEHVNYPLGTPVERHRIPILIAAMGGTEATLVGTEVWRVLSVTSGP